MKTKITVKELNHEDLVNLLSTALYDSSWFEADYDNNIYKSLKIKEGYCLEDKLADMLLAGHKITIIDHEAQGISYSKKCVGFDGESAIYEITLKDFLKTASTEKGFKLVDEVLAGDGDYYTGDAFLQRVLFGDVIYG